MRDDPGASRASDNDPPWRPGHDRSADDWHRDGGPASRRTAEAVSARTSPDCRKATNATCTSTDIRPTTCSPYTSSALLADAAIRARRRTAPTSMPGSASKTMSPTSATPRPSRDRAQPRP